MRPIDADELAKTLYENIRNDNLRIFSEVCNHIKNAPTVDAVPVVHGHWIFKRDVIGTKYECSECGHSDSKTTAIRGHYCWYCGARMDGERKEDGGL